jgi:hypothetical protein
VPRIKSFLDHFLKTDIPENINNFYPTEVAFAADRGLRLGNRKAVTHSSSGIGTLWTDLLDREDRLPTAFVTEVFESHVEMRRWAALPPTAPTAGN